MSDHADGPSQSKGPRAYGADFADCFGMPAPPTHISRTLRRGLMAVSELKFDSPITQRTSLGYDDAFLVSVWLRSHTDHECWYNGRPLPVESFNSGETYFFDLRLDPWALVREESHVLHFYLPLAALNSFAEQNESPLISDLVYKPGVGNSDPVMRHLARAALHAFSLTHGATGLLLDEILNAACAQVIGHYGTTRIPDRRISGLAQWQERRAKEMMRENLDVSLAELASECRLSVQHFARAFRRSTGMSPHQWLIVQRVEKAKSLLGESRLTLAEIAAACGFSSQSHLNAAFKQATGTTPGRWRRPFDPAANIADN